MQPEKAELAEKKAGPTEHQSPRENIGRSPAEHSNCWLCIQASLARRLMIRWRLCNLGTWLSENDGHSGCYVIALFLHTPC